MVGSEGKRDHFDAEQLRHARRQRVTDGDDSTGLVNGRAEVRELVGMRIRPRVQISAMKGEDKRKLVRRASRQAASPVEDSVPVYQAPYPTTDARATREQDEPDHAEFNQRPNQQVVGTTALEERRAVRNTGGPNGIQGV